MTTMSIKFHIGHNDAVAMIGANCVVDDYTDEWCPPLPGQRKAAEQMIRHTLRTRGDESPYYTFSDNCSEKQQDEVHALVRKLFPELT